MNTARGLVLILIGIVAVGAPLCAGDAGPQMGWYTPPPVGSTTPTDLKLESVLPKAGIPKELRAQVERLYSSKPADRADALRKLRLSSSSVEPGIPWFVALLADDSQVHSREMQSCGMLSYDFDTTPGLEAARALARLGERGLSALTKATADSSPVVRKYAVYGIADTPGPACVDQLKAALQDKEPSVRAAAVRGLARLDDAREGPIVEAMKDPDPAVRAAAADALSALHPSRESELVALLKDENEGVRASAAQALGRMHASETSYELIKLLTDSSPRVRERAAWALGCTGKEPYVPSVVPALVNVVKDKDRNVRATALVSISQLSESEGITRSLAAVSDPDPFVRFRAVQILGSANDARAFPALLPLLKDPDAMVRRTAVLGIARQRDPRAVSHVADMLSDPQQSVRSAAVTALGWLKASNPAPSVIPKLKDKNPMVREYAASALGQLDDYRAVGPLAELLSDESVEVRKSAESALTRFTDPRAVEELIKAYAQSPKSQALEDVLRKVTGYEFCRTPDEWRKWWDENKATWKNSGSSPTTANPPSSAP